MYWISRIEGDLRGTTHEGVVGMIGRSSLVTITEALRTAHFHCQQSRRTYGGRLHSQEEVVKASRA